MSDRAPTYAWTCARCDASNLALVSSCAKCGSSAFARGSELLQPLASAGADRPPRGLPKGTYRLVGLLTVLHGFAPATVLGLGRQASTNDDWSAFLLLLCWPLWLIPLSRRGANSIWSQLVPVALSLLALAPVTYGLLFFGIMVLTGAKT